MKTAVNGPLVWNSILERLRFLYPSVILAGGAVRDWAVDKTIKPKDIDLFISAPDPVEFEMSLFDLVNVPGFEKARFLYPSFEEYHSYNHDANKPDDGPPVVAVMEGIDNQTGLRYNVIGKRASIMTRPEVLASTFDHSLAQFWFDGDVNVRMTDAAQATLDNGKIELFIDSPRTRDRLNDLLRRPGYAKRFTYDGYVGGKANIEFDMLFDTKQCLSFKSSL